MPPAVPYIIGNETAERFSFYGMRTILMVYMTQFLCMSEQEAAGYGHLFQGAVYLFPFFGALLADLFFGKFRIIFWLSLVYCLGHFILALPGSLFGENPRIPLFWGLALIAIGAGGIKSCTSAIVGDQFTQENQHLLSRVFGWFYLAINVGALVSSFLTPLLLENYGPEIAFGVPGVLMALATLILWLGRKKYVHIPPSPQHFFHEAFSREGGVALLKILTVFLFLIPFWAVYEQSSFRWVAQAEKMNPHVFAWFSPLAHYTLLPSQVQAVNPFLILTLVPLFSYVLYPAIDRFYKLTMVRKIAIGFFLTIPSAAFPYVFEACIDRGITLNIGWQVLAYLLLTAAEVMISITSLEFAYTQAPRSMKSLVMGVYLLMITCGNFFVAAINRQCELSPTFLPGTQYYAMFLILATLNAVGFLFVAAVYQEKTCLQPVSPKN
ncbi:MAG: MFS transporter [Planctomycetia bacterium]|nr:MFS transporter [Planctomycetia bacterium]